MTTSLIVAASRNEVIGAGGDLPWHLSDDLRRFRRITKGHVVVVGRVTHESITARLGRPLPGRTSVVVSSRPGVCAGAGSGPSGGAGYSGDAGSSGDAGAEVVWTTSLEDAMETGGLRAVAGEVFVIGGASVYRQALPHVDKIYLTRVHREVAGDTSMPPGWLDGFTLVAREDRTADGLDCGYSWLDYERTRS